MIRRFVVVDCEDCAAAATSMHGRTHSDCEGCVIRRIAQGPHFFASARAGWMTEEYRRSLEDVFGDAILDGHARVWAERDRLDALRAALASKDGQRR